jgi:membrane protease YdiL (CAAX protease family)
MKRHEVDSLAKPYNLNHVLVLLLLYFGIRFLVINRQVLSSPKHIPSWNVILVELIIFSIIAALLVITRSESEIYNVDNLSLIIFFLFSTLLRMNNPNTNLFFTMLSYLFLFTLSIFAIFSIRRGPGIKRFSNKQIRWIIISVIFSIALAGLFAYPGRVRALIESNERVPFTGLLVSVIIYFLYEVAHTSILEEPIFRGFLWGYLRKKGFNERRILWIQAFLFWISHIGFINTFYAFFLTIPIRGLFFGWLVLRSKSLAPSIIAHAIYNSVILTLKTLTTYTLG